MQPDMQSRVRKAVTILSLSVCGSILMQPWSTHAMRENKQRARWKLSLGCRRQPSHSLSGWPSKSGERFYLSRLGEVTSVQAKGKCVWLQRNASCYLFRESISVVAEKLKT